MSLVLVLGTKTAAQAMQRLTLFGEDGFPYLDDYIVASETFDDHIEKLCSLATKLKSANLTINFDKCQFCKQSLKYLGFLVDQYGLRTDPEKVECILNYPKPKTVTEIRRFMGLASWYRRFVPNFASLAAPLHELTKNLTKYKHLKWTKEADDAFLKLKSTLIAPPVLATPDFSKRFTIQCDASKLQLGQY